MNCSTPPPLSDDVLSSILDNAADGAALDHLARCPSCAARVQAARHVESHLHMRLSRFDCPAPDRLGEYHFNMLPADEERAVRTHLATCLRCQEELEQLRVFMLADDPEALPAPPPSKAALRPTLRAPRLRELVARLLPPAPAVALRGAQSRTRTYEADGGVTVLLDAQPAPAGVTLAGQFLADDEAAWEGALVEARQNGALVATTVLDDLAMFRLGPLAATSTDLRIVAASGVSVVLAGVELAA